jgi:hypothetical protein
MKSSTDAVEAHMDIVDSKKNNQGILVFMIGLPYMGMKKKWGGYDPPHGWTEMRLSDSESRWPF